MVEETSSLNEERARAREAFERLAADMAALPPEKVIRVNLDVPTVVGTVIAKLPGIRAMRPQIERDLPSFDLERFDKLEDMALALFYAQGAYLAASEPKRSLEELARRGFELRRLMMADAATQEVRGIFDAKRLAELRQGSGYRDLAEDLIALVNLYRGHWPLIANRTAITMDEIEHAESLAAQLVIAVGERDLVPVARSAAMEQRERAFALLVEAYNDARRAVLYLRAYDGDADEIAPSLYAGRTRPRDDAVEPTSPGEPQPSTSQPSALLPSEPSPSEALSRAAPPAPAELAQKARMPEYVEPPPGFPGGSPFTE